ncbi:MAG: cell division protein FtsZ [Erysipelothrix sp.]|nr:cell division protein FtsZ [Erysipelothrix sp.]
MTRNNKAVIRVIGVGGAGCNAVSRMVEEGMQGVEFFVANTDIQSLESSPVNNKIVLGPDLTGGLGAGGSPDFGKRAAEESEDDLRAIVKGADMIFVTAGMGGGTGTGAAPLVAKIAQEEGALVVGIVTKPFLFEGPGRGRNAASGLDELKKHVDSLIIISNNQLLEVIGNIPFLEAFLEADNVLRQGVQTITDLIAVPALINLDFADVKSIMKQQGAALIGIGMAEGENKAVKAAESSITSPLLEAKIQGAKKAIINVTGGETMNIMDASAAVDYIRDAAGFDMEIIFGVAINDNIGDAIIVTLIATGFEDDAEEHEVRNKFNKDFKMKSHTTPNINKEVEPEEDPSGIPDFFRRN